MTNDERDALAGMCDAIIGYVATDMDPFRERERDALLQASVKLRNMMEIEPKEINEHLS
jgi:hypothetical protein